MLLPIVVLFLRIGPILPANAIGRPLRVGEAWKRTKPSRALILRLIAVICLADVSLFSLNWILERIGPGTIPISFAVGWLTSMFYLTLLATLYGHLIEGRPLR